MRFLIRAGRGSVVLAVGVACAAFAAPATADIAPAGTVTAAPAVSRPGNAPAVHAPAPPSNVVINRPTMSMKAYRQAKAAASRAPYVAKPGASRSGQSRAATAHGFAGVNKAGSDGWFPSDVNGAVGAGRNVLTTNDRYVVYKKATTQDHSEEREPEYVLQLCAPSRCSTRASSSTRRGSGSWSRPTRSRSPARVQILGLAFSQTKNPAGGTWNYLINGKQICGNDVFVDYPQISTTPGRRDGDGQLLPKQRWGLPRLGSRSGGEGRPLQRPAGSACRCSATSAAPPRRRTSSTATRGRTSLLAGGGTAVRDCRSEPGRAGSTQRWRLR